MAKLTMTIDMGQHVALSREVLEELQRRFSQLHHDTKERDALISTLLDVTFDYLEAIKKMN